MLLSGLLWSSLLGCEVSVEPSTIGVNVTLDLAECLGHLDCGAGEYCQMDGEDASDNQCVSACGGDEIAVIQSNGNVVCHQAGPCAGVTCAAGEICVPITIQIGVFAVDFTCSEVTTDNSCQEAGFCCEGQDNSCKPADCYCDEKCLDFGDCCSDYVHYCY